jgi:hypothetical protein
MPNTCSHERRMEGVPPRDAQHLRQPAVARTCRGAGRDILRGAEPALGQPGAAPAALVALDASGGGRSRRRGHLGDVHSSQVGRTAPILSEAGILRAPAATFSRLAGPLWSGSCPTTARSTARSTDWAVEAGARRPLVVRDHDRGYGVPVGEMCVAAAGARGLDVRSTRSAPAPPSTPGSRRPG